MFCYGPRYRTVWYRPRYRTWRPHCSLWVPYRTHKQKNSVIQIRHKALLYRSWHSTVFYLPRHRTVLYIPRPNTVQRCTDPHTEGCGTDPEYRTSGPHCRWWELPRSYILQNGVVQSRQSTLCHRLRHRTVWDRPRRRTMLYKPRHRTWRPHCWPWGPHRSWRSSAWRQRPRPWLLWRTTAGSVPLCATGCQPPTDPSGSGCVATSESRAATALTPSQPRRSCIKAK